MGGGEHARGGGGRGRRQPGAGGRRTSADEIGHGTPDRSSGAFIAAGDGSRLAVVGEPGTRPGWPS